MQLNVFLLLQCVFFGCFDRLLLSCGMRKSRVLALCMAVWFCLILFAHHIAWHDVWNSVLSVMEFVFFLILCSCSSRSWSSGSCFAVHALNDVEITVVGTVFVVIVAVRVIAVVCCMVSCSSSYFLCRRLRLCRRKAIDRSLPCGSLLFSSALGTKGTYHGESVVCIGVFGCRSGSVHPCWLRVCLCVSMPPNLVSFSFSLYTQTREEKEPTAILIRTRTAEQTTREPRTDLLRTGSIPGVCTNTTWVLTQGSGGIVVSVPDTSSQSDIRLARDDGCKSWTPSRSLFSFF